MHSYSVKKDNKNTIITLILILSGLIDLCLNIFIGNVINTTEEMMKYGILFVFAYLTSYSGVYYIYNHFLWKFPILSKHPDISGNWIGEIHNNKKISKEVNVEIKQTWDEIVMILSTDTADSKTKTLSMDNEDRLVIDYIFINETKGISNNELKNHEGTGKLFISTDLRSMHGEYYTNHHRKSYGEINLKKVYQ